MRIQDIVLVVGEVHTRITPTDFPISISAIKLYIEQTLKINFSLFDSASWTSKHIWGRLRRYESNGKNCAEIVVAESLNTCWKRFVACKELAQLLIDNCDEDMTSNPIGLIQGLVEMPVAIDSDVVSERLAMIAAIELLVPWSQREAVYGMVADGKTNYEIASVFKVPEKIVEMWRSDRYQEIIAKAWVDISQAAAA